MLFGRVDVRFSAREMHKSVGEPGDSRLAFFFRHSARVLSQQRCQPRHRRVCCLRMIIQHSDHLICGQRPPHNSTPHFRTFLPATIMKTHDILWVVSECC
jgi:hypothetical protein